MGGRGVLRTRMEISPEERQRLLECSQEPIRTPGAVQSHGVVLIVDATTFEVVYASENSATVFGMEAATLLGRALADVTGHAAVSAIRDVLDETVAAANPVSVIINSHSFDSIVSAAGPRVTGSSDSSSSDTRTLVAIDFEPTILPSPLHSASSLYDAILRLSRATTMGDLWTGTARELRILTGFDRVMVYHFYPDDHGEIVAEERPDDMEPYLGLHYPASDIPAQARELYLTKLSRMIADSSDDGSALISLSDSAGDAWGTLDLSHAELRAVSPHHRQFMRNMGQASTLSLSLVHDGRLVGMITCANRTPLRLPFLMRQGLEILANQVSLQLASMREIERLTQQVRVRSIRSRLLGQLSGTTGMVEALFNGELTVLDLIPADGATLHIYGVTTSIGTVPVEAELTSLVESARRDGLELPVFTEEISSDYPELAVFVPTVAGMLLLPLGGSGSYIAWFRQEISKSVNWLGDQSPTNRVSTLSPRDSFSSWTQSVRGSSQSWDGLDIEAAELCRDLDGVLLRRAESKLAALALHDPLTGLANRRLLTDRLEHALTKYARGEELALLFIDLDRFKVVNDTYGHDVGDALIVHAAGQILAATRPEDTVARLGGDEFVVLCEGTTGEEADVISRRLIDAISEPLTTGGTTLSITASIGVTAANLSFSATDLIRQADTAMYRAKQRGRNQASR